MTHSGVPTRWKFKEFLDANGLTPYKVAQATAGRLSQNAVYNLTKEPTSLRISTFDVLIPALEELTGRRVEISELLEFVR